MSRVASWEIGERAAMADPDEARAAPGRPKDADKREAIMGAARRLFFERGPGAVSIEAVAAAAQVSRMTVYGHFGDKNALFAAVIAREAAALEGALKDIRCGGARGVRGDLIAFGKDLTSFLLRPDQRAFNRLIEAEGPRHAKLAQAFVEAGPRNVFRSLVERLRRADQAGDIAAPDPAKAARHLTGLYKSIETSAFAVGLAPPPSRSEVERHVTECVDVFLRAYAA